MMTLARNWFAFVLRGIVALIFGIWAFFFPGMALLTLVFLFGFYAILDGIFSLSAARKETLPIGPNPAVPSSPMAFDYASEPRWALVVEGVIGIIAGLIALFIPAITALVLLYVIAGWAIVTGVLEILAAVRLREEINHEWLFVLAGILSIAFGLLIAFFPGAGALAVILWIGIYAIIFGIVMIALGVKLHNIVQPGSPTGFGRMIPSH